MADKIFGSDFTNDTNPSGNYTVSVNNGSVLVDSTLADIASKVPHNSTSKATPVDADELPLVDSAASNVLKKLTWANVKATLNAVYDWATVAHAAVSKTTPVDADELAIVDSAASNTIKKLTWANLKATLNSVYQSDGKVPDSDRTKYIITPSISSNNLTVAIKYLDGNDCTSTNKIIFRIGDTEFTLSSSLSTTKNAGTNWFNSGAAETAALDIDYFVYVIGETGASAGLKVGFSRIPYALTMNDFVNTSTNEKYIAGNWTNFNATDKVRVIGRFRAQLSASASFNWSIPNALVINFPVFETGLLNYAVAWVATGTQPAIGNGTSFGRYIVRNRRLFLHAGLVMGSTTTFGTGTYTFTMPFTTLSDQAFPGPASVYDASADTMLVMNVNFASASNVARLRSHNTVGLMSPTVPITLAQSDTIAFSGEPALP